MRLANPWWLLLLMPVAGLVALLWLRSRQPNGIRFSDVATWQARLPRTGLGPDEIIGALIALGLTLAVLAMARPQSGLRSEELSGRGVDVMLCLDTSGSMRSIDFKPQNRFGAAKEVSRKFIQSRPHDRLGLVVFGGVALTVCPLTRDKQALLQLLDQTQIDMTGVDGTAVGMALATSVDRLRESPAVSKVILLVTDGRNNQGAIDPMTAAKAAAALGVKIYTVGAGAPGGGMMPVSDPLFGTRYVKLEEDLDEDLLRRVAAETRGLYFRAKDERGLAQIFDRINQMEKSDYQVKEFTHYRDLYPGWLLAALVCLLTAAGLKTFAFRRLP